MTMGTHNLESPLPYLLFCYIIIINNQQHYHQKMFNLSLRSNQIPLEFLVRITNNMWYMSFHVTHLRDFM